MARKTNYLQALMDETWTTTELARRARCTTMTIHTWRKKAGLPSIVIKGDSRPAVRFVPADVKAWARDQQITLARK